LVQVGRRRTGKNDMAYPERPLLTAAWIPAAVVLLPLGGALGAFGPWLVAPAVVLSLIGGVGVMYALVSLCPSAVLRRVALGLLLAPLIAVPLLSMHAAQATVLQLQGTDHPGTVTGIRVSQSKSTTYYDCTVRYDGAPAQFHTVDCNKFDTVGERVNVTQDPSGLVGPEFSDAVAGAAANRTLAVFFDAALLVIAGAAAVTGAIVQRVRSRHSAGSISTSTS
jgi:hypothetical protein